VNSKEKALQIEMKIRDDRKGAAVFRRTGTVQRIYGLQKGKKDASTTTGQHMAMLAYQYQI
jgi:hypothetical protein